jgi:acyl carrier protein
VSLEEIVIEVIAQEITPLSMTFSLDTPLEELGIDSLKAITIMYELEDRLNIDIPNEAFDSLKNVGDIVKQLEVLIARGGAACLDG